MPLRSNHWILDCVPEQAANLELPLSSTSAESVAMLDQMHKGIDVYLSSALISTITYLER